MSIISRTISLTLYIVFLAVLFLGGLKLADRWILDKPGSRLGSIGDPGMNGYVDPERPDITMNTFDLYPWTGGHIQANFKLRGGTFRSGDHGFFIDFDLDRPPPKAVGEFRVIWIGGSAAQGFGAHTNENMMYRVLERLFAEQPPCAPTVKLSVINLAMAGSVAHQNFNALNRWGHDLKPDLILTFAGVNDLAYMFGGLDGWFGFSTVQGYVLMSRFAASPPYLKVLARWYPGLFKSTAFGMALRTFRFQDLERRALRSYEAQYPPQPKSAAERVEKIAVPRFVHSLKSIKRDFLGIPVFVVFQPFMSTTANPGSVAEGPIKPDEYRLYYASFISDARQALDGYLNTAWFFFDAHDYYAREMSKRYSPGDGVHLSDAKQMELGAAIGQRLFPVVCRLAAAQRN
jgi:lysophospholipase L1-like esterase